MGFLLALVAFSGGIGGLVLLRRHQVKGLAPYGFLALMALVGGEVLNEYLTVWTRVYGRQVAVALILIAIAAAAAWYGYVGFRRNNPRRSK